MVGRVEIILNAMGGAVTTTTNHCHRQSQASKLLVHLFHLLHRSGIRANCDVGFVFDCVFGTVLALSAKETQLLVT
jgi:hypothetical protein